MYDASAAYGKLLESAIYQTASKKKPPAILAGMPIAIANLPLASSVQDLLDLISGDEDADSETDVAHLVQQLLHTHGGLLLESVEQVGKCAQSVVASGSERSASDVYHMYTVYRWQRCRQAGSRGPWPSSKLCSSDPWVSDPNAGWHMLGILVWWPYVAVSLFVDWILLVFKSGLAGGPVLSCPGLSIHISAGSMIVVAAICSALP